MIEVNQIYNLDAIKFLEDLPSNSVKAIIADPPYGNNNGGNDLAGARARDSVKGGRKRGAIPLIANDTVQEWCSLMEAFLQEVNRVLCSEGVLSCFTSGGGPNTAFSWLVQAIETYMEFDHAVIWDKSARGYGMGWRYRRNYEFIYIAHKRGGSLAWNPERVAQPNVVYFQPPQNTDHPTTKPFLLMEWLVLNHTIAGDLVVDPFMGSGTTLDAARQNNRNYIGCDLDEGYCNVVRQRLAAPYTPPMFPDAQPTEPPPTQTSFLE
jgi:site-specific DNA-methyltransferase (adenine-specific)